uniref:Bifunctional polynucleotide phosphatase/kinase n=1 Tax=Parastrongyloides trichosuri TaxID=131310 RepID=A0A0N4ZK26_PARTI
MPKRKNSPIKTPNPQTKKPKYFSIFEMKQEPVKKGTWKCTDEVWIYTHKDIQSKKKIASFDMDHTLIKPKGSGIHPKFDDDWEYLFPTVPTKLKKLHKDDYKIVIFTNQKGISTKKNSKIDIKKRVEDIINKLDIPIQVFVSLGHPKYRKPYKGMWELLSKEHNGDVDISIEDSIYVGDGAGRMNVSENGRRDFTNSDRLFALNIGIKFKDPEEFFLDQTYNGRYNEILFDPKTAFLNKQPLLLPKNSHIMDEKQEIIVLVGITGCGKSHFVSKHLNSERYRIINDSDIAVCKLLGKKSSAEEILESGKSLVIDGENLTKSVRKSWINMAKEKDIIIRCFYFDVNIFQCIHNMMFKQIIGQTKYHPHVKKDIMLSKSNLEKPSKEEGFEEIVRINFCPEFDNKDHEEIYQNYLPL